MEFWVPWGLSHAERKSRKIGIGVHLNDMDKDDPKGANTQPTIRDSVMHAYSIIDRNEEEEREEGEIVEEVSVHENEDRDEQGHDASQYRGSLDSYGSDERKNSIDTATDRRMSISSNQESKIGEREREFKKRKRVDHTFERARKPLEGHTVHTDDGNKRRGSASSTGSKTATTAADCKL